MKQYKFHQKGYHGISCYSCCNTCHNFQHEQQQELTKRAPNIVRCSKPIYMD